MLQQLARHCEAPDVDEEQAPVRRCHRYLSDRRNQLNYKDALAKDLPIGSGEIESAHRYIAQQRLKRPGAWWRVKHAEYMLALRVTRRNGDWDANWASIGKNGSSAMAQISTDQPYHENPQCDCITFGSHPGRPQRVMSRAAVSASGTFIALG